MGMRPVAVLLLIVGALAQYEPLLPPKERIEKSMAIPPLHDRRNPVVYSGKPTHDGVALSASKSAINASVVHESIGNEISHRHYMDFPNDLMVACPGLRFSGSGHIDTWEVYTGRDCELTLQILRPIGSGKKLAHQQYRLTRFQSVGANTVFAPNMGHHVFEIPEDEQIYAEIGDIIAFHTTSPGCISWSNGGHRVFFKYNVSTNYPTKDESLGEFLFIGEGSHRTYSIGCSGDLTYSPTEVRERSSPSPTPSNRPTNSPSSTPTTSPSRSASLSPSLSPLRTFSASISISRSVTVSLSPTATPTTFSTSSDCAQGPEFWCENGFNMKMCNITHQVCEVLKKAFNPPLPSPVYPTTTPTASPSFSPSFYGILPSVLPSPTPSMSLVTPPYFLPPTVQVENVRPVRESNRTHSNTTERIPSSGGLAQCLYCAGGGDWNSDTCMSGKFQSPVSIKFDSSMDVPAELDLYLAVRYNITRATAHWDNTGLSLRSQFFGSINIDSVNYVADIVKVRAPSEHKLEGMRTPLELQIFHRLAGSNPPKIVAVSVLFEETLSDVPSLDWITQLPRDMTDMKLVVDLEDYLSDQKPLAFYDGSMTEPPCQEGITWAVTMGTKKVNFKQVEHINSFLKNNPAFALGRGNNRAVQSLGSRQVTLRSNCGISGAMACGRGTAKAEGMPGGPEAVDINDAPPKLSPAAQREQEMAPSASVKQTDESVHGGDDSMFDDGDVKLW